MKTIMVNLYKKLTEIKTKFFQSVATVLMTTKVLLVISVLLMGWINFNQAKHIKDLIKKHDDIDYNNTVMNKIKNEVLLNINSSLKSMLSKEDPSINKQYTFKHLGLMNDLFNEISKDFYVKNIQNFENIRVYLSDYTIFLQNLSYKDSNNIDSVTINNIQNSGELLFKSIEIIEFQLDSYITKIKFDISLAVQQIFWINIIGGIFIVGIAVFSAVLSNKLILVPLGNIKKGVDSLMQGRFDQPINIDRIDEFGELAQTFNEMAMQLQILISDLEQRVNDRTRELGESNKNLQEEILEHKKAEESLQQAYEELKTVQSQLLHAEKMASVGQLAAGVAHEINNPLGFISNNVEMLEQYVTTYLKLIQKLDNLKTTILQNEFDRSKEAIDDIDKFEEEMDMEFLVKDMDSLLKSTKDGLERVRKIVLDLRTFAHGGNDTEDMVKVEEVIESVLNIVDNELKYKALLKKDYQETSFIKSNVQRLGQVFINILVNAVQAMDEKGILDIKTYNKDGFVCVDIKDSGKGMDETTLKKLFDPFFTTKPVGKGTGLGLTVSYEIVKKHGGDIIVQSQPGKGSTFTIKIPAADLKAKA